MSLTLQRIGGGDPVALPSDVSARLLKTFPNARSHVAAVSSNEKLIVIPPAGVALLGQTEVDGPLVPQCNLRTRTHIWHPSAAPTSVPDRVVFVGQPLQLCPGEQFPFQLHAFKMETAEEKITRIVDFDKKQAQLKSALESNKRAYAEAKKSGEVVDVGALAIERDRIEEELAIPFVPNAASRSVDEILIAPLTIELPLGMFKHPESGLLFRLELAPDLKDDFQRITPQMLVNKHWAP